MSINEHPDNMASLLRWKDERIRELEAENAKLRDELAEIEATTVPSGQYLDVVAQCDKLHAEFERGKLPDGFPKIICLCGSSRFISELAITGWELEKKGYIALGLHLLPRRYTDLPDHLAEAQGVKETMDELHKRKIDLADEVLILNIGGYIGESTRSELEYARAHGKPVRFIEPEVE